LVRGRESWVMGHEGHDSRPTTLERAAGESGSAGNSRGSRALAPRHGGGRREHRSQAHGGGRRLSRRGAPSNERSSRLRAGAPHSAGTAPDRIDRRDSGSRSVRRPRLRLVHADRPHRAAGRRQCDHPDRERPFHSAAVAPRQTRTSGRTTSISFSIQARHASISRLLGFLCQRRQPLIRCLKCLTTLVT